MDGHRPAAGKAGAAARARPTPSRGMPAAGGSGARAPRGAAGRGAGCRRGSPGPRRGRQQAAEPRAPQQGLSLPSLLGIWYFVLQETVTAAPDLMNTEMCTEKSI